MGDSRSMSSATTLGTPRRHQGLNRCSYLLSTISQSTMPQCNQSLRTADSKYAELPARLTVDLGAVYNSLEPEPRGKERGLV